MLMGEQGEGQGAGDGVGQKGAGELSTGPNRPGSWQPAGQPCEVHTENSDLRPKGPFLHPCSFSHPPMPPLVPLL